MADYAQALDIFNETVASLNQIADVQHVSTVNEITAIQAQSMDPSDMGAYNLTMYGMNSIHESKTHIVGTVGNVSNYYLPLDSAAVDSTIIDPTPVATSASYVTEHTSISSSLVSFPGGGSENLFSHFLADPACILPTETPSLWLVYGIFGLLLGKFLIMRR